jgi:hypothetical protein
MLSRKPHDHPGLTNVDNHWYGGNPRVFHLHCKRVSLIRNSPLPSATRPSLLGWLLIFYVVPERTFRCSYCRKSWMNSMTWQIDSNPFQLIRRTLYRSEPLFPRKPSGCKHPHTLYKFALPRVQKPRVHPHNRREHRPIPCAVSAPIPLHPRVPSFPQTHSHYQYPYSSRRHISGNPVWTPTQFLRDLAVF